MNRGSALWAAVAVLLAMLLTGCASHLISTNNPEGTCAAGMDCTAAQTSFAGRSGASSEGVTGHVAKECGNQGLDRVEVRRSLGQGLVTVLTLGLISPATLHYQCKKPPAPPEGPTPPDEL
jgi:hypothetical protein